MLMALVNVFDPERISALKMDPLDDLAAAGPIQWTTPEPDDM